MRVQWAVDDGYVGKSRPKFTEVDDAEIDEIRETGKEDGISEEEIERQVDEYINEAVQDDFEQRITFYIVSRG